MKLLKWTGIFLGAVIALGLASRALKHPQPEQPETPAEIAARREVEDKAWRDRHTRKEPPPATSAESDTACLKIGAICQLKDISIINGVVWVPTATSIAAYEEFKKSQAAGDKEGLIQLLQSGGLLTTKPRTTLRVLEFSIWEGRTEARITSGEHTGRKVWVRSQWVVP